MVTNTNESDKQALEALFAGLKVSKEDLKRIEDDHFLYGQAFLKINRKTKEGTRLNPLNLIIKNEL